MTWDPGRARHQVTFQSATRAGDGRGGSVKTYTDVAALSGVWVEMKPLRSMERLRAMQLSAEPTHEVRMWYTSAVTRGMRFTYEGRNYEIVSEPVSPNEERVVTEFLARQLTAVSA